MRTFFTRQRYGRPQAIAVLLLLMFLLQCAWLVRKQVRAGGPSEDEFVRIVVGLQLWHGKSPAFLAQHSDLPGIRASIERIASDRDHSRLRYLIAAAPFLLGPHPISEGSIPSWIWLARLPYLVMGSLLGASVWYVSRRLYGNAGGYIALALYCFSPAIIRSTSLWSAPPEIGGAWGGFGSVFTGIAVAHTLYAPREVVLWNWRRILLLGLSFALAGGSQFSLIMIVPVALALMLYVAPTRRGAAAGIWGAACLVGFLILLAAYGFHITALDSAIRQARLVDFTGEAFLMSGTYLQALSNIVHASPALIVALPLALAVYSVWRRARYFGNTAPLLVVLLLLLCSLGSIHYPGMGFSLVMAPFLFVFAAGIAGDLLETQYRDIVLSSTWGLLFAGAAWNLLQLART